MGLKGPNTNNPGLSRSEARGKSNLSTNGPEGAEL